jgi:hypothetical protein
MPSRRPGLFLFVTVAAVQLASAQTIVNSVFQVRNHADYGDANNWLPAEVPNNSPGKSYNVTVTTPYFVELNVDATISNLVLNGTCLGNGHSLTVIGTATLRDSRVSIHSSSTAQAVFSAGLLSTFSDGSLTGSYYLSDYSTLQFGGADVTTLSKASLALVGPNARLVDEAGKDGLRHLTRIDSGSTLQMNGHPTIVAGPFTNDGLLVLTAAYDQPGLFTITGPLTNFDTATRTLVNGGYYLGGNYIVGSNYPTVVQFPGADIVHNGGTISLSGPLAKITDENGLDALRNFSHNTASGVFSVGDYTIPRDFTNDGVLSLGGTFTVSGSLTNFDLATRTLTSGTYQLGGKLVFDGADIVHNAAEIYLYGAAKILDQSGNNALRNFAHNLKGGEFTINSYSMFTAAADFANEGVVNILGSGDIARSHFTVPEGHRYTQTEGETSLLDANFTGKMEILGGSFTTAGNPYFGNPAFLDGDLTIDDALFAARSFTVHGTVHLSAKSRLLTRPEEYGANFTVDETFTAGGTLQIAAPQSTPSATAIYRVVESSGGIIGTFSNAPHGRRIPTIDGRGSFIVTYTPNSILLSGFQATPATGQLLNISTRVSVETGDKVLIGGFIIAGTQPKKVMVRAIGPSLSSFFPGVLADPILELRNSSGDLIASNDNWRSNQEAEIIATTIPPSHNLESAIVATLPAQNSAYTAIVRGVNNGTGIGLVEVYDLAQTLDSKPANISTRGFVQTGDNVLIGGLIVLGQDPLRIIVRATGPSLPVPQPLGDPTLSLYDSNGGLIASNDNWHSDQEADIIATGLQPSNNLESAIVATLPANGGSYTAIVRGNKGASGVALVEVYDINH